MNRMKEMYRIAHPNNTDGNLYQTLIKEEFKEFVAEYQDTPNDFKEILDLMWVCMMYCIEHNYPIEEGMRELHKEFMSKFYNNGIFDPQYREDGKLMKGDGFKKGNFNKFFRED